MYLKTPTGYVGRVGDVWLLNVNRPQAFCFADQQQARQAQQHIDASFRNYCWPVHRP